MELDLDTGHSTAHSLPGPLLLSILKDKKPGSSIKSLINATTIDLMLKLFSRDDYNSFAAQLTDISDAKDLLDFMLHILHLFHNLRLTNLDGTVDIKWRARRFMLNVITKMPVIPESLIVTGIRMPAEHDHIGRGGFGHVFKGKLGGNVVALKVLYKADNNVAFCREALMWRSLRHEFVLPFLGIYQDERMEQFFLVSPYMNNGTLVQWRTKANPSIAEVEGRILEVAKGIEYIHSEGIVHGDLRGVNILLDANLHVQIADFGLTRVSDATNTRSGALHVNFAAPELFGYCEDDDSKEDDDDPIRTQKSDVYAFGCLYYEIHYGSIPFSGKRDVQIIALVSRGAHAPRLNSPPLSDEAWELMRSCWVRDASKRPTIEDVRRKMVVIFQSASVFSTLREKKQRVIQAEHKEGYLTKRGKNFGGWKTRYFVLQGPVLEYYDYRGGTHLGSIVITGAQIGRQQQSDQTGTDNDSEYRHAFLIVEAKKRPGGHHPRHVLCAENDGERDSWVDMLVRYFTGTYSEEPLSNASLSSIASGPAPAPPRASSGSIDSSAAINRTRAPPRDFSRHVISISKGLAIPTTVDEQTVTPVPRAVFGVPLDESLDVAQICNLPAIIFRAIQYLEAKKADQEEGIYRVSGSSAVIKSLKGRFNLEGDVDLLASDEYWDPHAIAGLLKSFLRELPVNILTRELLHLRFLAVIDFVNPQERIRELSQLMAALPLPNYTLLRALTAHLILIVQNSAVNKMTMRNVCIVFGPTLGIPADAVSLMLGEFNRVFNVDANDGDEAQTEGSVGSSSDHDLYRRNSQRYSEAAADQLLGLSGRSLKAATMHLMEKT